MSEKLDIRTRIIRGMQARSDGWYSALTGIGARSMATQFSAELVLGIDYLDDWYSADDLAARIVDAVVEHAMANGFGVAEDGEDGELAKAIERWSIVERSSEAAIWGRLFGGALAVLVEKDRALSAPLDVRPGSLERITVIDRGRLEIFEVDEWGEPVTYRVRGNEGTNGAEMDRKIHASRAIRFRGAHTSERQRAQRQGWDASVLQRTVDAIRDFRTAWGGIVHLATDLTQPVYKIKDLAMKIAAGREQDIADRIGLIEASRSIARAVMVDAEEEDYTHLNVGATAGGASDVATTMYQRVAASAQMPVTLLLGMSPAGLNATGEADLRSWYSTVEAYRKQRLEGPLSQLVAAVAATEGIPLESVTLTWPSMWSLSPLEEAELQSKITAADAVRHQLGIISTEELRRGTWGTGRWSMERAHGLSEDGPTVNELAEPDLV